MVDEELHRMTNSNYIKFRSLFVENLMNNELWQRNFKQNSKAMNLLLNSIVLILCKKVPTDLPVHKIETLHTKLKLLAPQHF